MANKRAVVAMSGGVDSSVVAAMLYKEGYEVIGVTMQLYDQGASSCGTKTKSCCGSKDIFDAKAVANHLGIAHYVLDYESIFKQEVIDDFVDSYIKGYTPIPCVKCNQSVKFRDLYKLAKDLGADFLATGHYVQKKVNPATGQAELHMGMDNAKDQSYFLFATTKEQIDFVEFPLGGYTKDQTRQMARDFGLPVSDKPDSQNICFVPSGNYAAVVEKFRPGAIDDGEIKHIVTDEVLGNHKGIINFTVGQRRGLNLKECKSDNTAPLYVVKIDSDSKIVWVGEEKFLLQKEFMVKDVNWLIDDVSDEVHAEVKLGSTETIVPGRIIDKCRIILDEPYRAVSPGQACVFYNNTQIIGGGWIC